MLEGNIGPEAKYDLKIEKGEVVVLLDYKGADARAKLEAAMPIDAWLEKLKAAIPGKIDDYLIDALKKAMVS